jgi:hypothetical protein
MRTPEEWISLFEKKAKVPFSIKPEERFVCNPEKGFLGYILNLEERTFVLTKLVGDGAYWTEKVLEFMREDNGATLGKFHGSTYRNPRAMSKLFGGKIVLGRITAGDRVCFHIESDLTKLAEAYENRRLRTCQE